MEPWYNSFVVGDTGTSEEWYGDSGLMGDDGTSEQWDQWYEDSGLMGDDGTSEQWYGDNGVMKRGPFVVFDKGVGPLITRRGNLVVNLVDNSQYRQFLYLFVNFVLCSSSMQQGGLYSCRGSLSGVETRDRSNLYKQGCQLS